MAQKVDPAVTAALEAQAKFKAQQAEEEAAKKAESGFEIFGTEPEVWEVGKEKYRFEFSPLKVKQIRLMLPLLTTLQEPLAEMFKSGTVNISALQRLDGEGLVECVALATNQTQEVVDDLEAGDFLRVCTKVLVVNGDFFVRTLPQLVGGAAVAVMRLVTANPSVAKGIVETVGPSPSSSSEATATPSPT